jgi:hypothetical protein
MYYAQKVSLSKLTFKWRLTSNRISGVLSAVLFTCIFYFYFIFIYILFVFICILFVFVFLFVLELDVGPHFIEAFRKPCPGCEMKRWCSIEKCPSKCVKEISWFTKTKFLSTHNFTDKCKSAVRMFRSVVTSTMSSIRMVGLQKKNYLENTFSGQCLYFSFQTMHFSPLSVTVLLWFL